MPQPPTPDPLSPSRLGGPAPDMLSVDEAIERVAAAFAPAGDYERVPILDALGRVLVEDIPADAPVPRFDNTAMDGYAVRAEDIAAATEACPITLRVAGAIAAGDVATTPLERGQAYRILTGAPMPPGADSVVPYEYTDGKGFGGWTGTAALDEAASEREVRVFRPVARGDNVRYQGEDFKAGEVVLRAGTVVRPAEVGMLATLGRAQVWVHRRPRVAVLSTGDELAPIDAPLGPGQIRDANRYSLAALVRHYGGEPIMLERAVDDPAAVRQRLREAIDHGADLILTSGGVSMGDRDVVKHVLQDDGDIAFWSIDLRPGKPLVFAHFQGVPILGLPGNPVSAIVTFELFGRVAVLRLAGHRRVHKVEVLATTQQAITNRSGRENFMRGIAERIREPDGIRPEWTVRLTGEQGSNILTSLTRANCLVRLPKARTHFQPGDHVTLLMLDWPPLW